MLRLILHEGNTDNAHSLELELRMVRCEYSLTRITTSLSRCLVPLMHWIFKPVSLPWLVAFRLLQTDDQPWWPDREDREDDGASGYSGQQERLRETPAHKHRYVQVSSSRHKPSGCQNWAYSWSILLSDAEQQREEDPGLAPGLPPHVVKGDPG